MNANSTQTTTTIHAASIITSEKANAQFGLSLPSDRLVLVTPDFAGLTSAAEIHPLNDPDLFADVQQLLIIDATAAMHVTVDLHSRNVGRFLAQGIMGGFLLVLTDESGQSARVVTAQPSIGSDSARLEAATYFRNLRPDTDQTKAYVVSVARIGWYGCVDMLDLARKGLAPARTCFRPVLNREHLAEISALGFPSLDELVKSGEAVPSFSKCFRDMMSSSHGPGITFTLTPRHKGH